MNRRRWQAGEGNVGCIIWAVILAVVVMIGWKAVPVKIASAELYDFMDDQSRFVKKRMEHKTVEAILHKADELGLPLTEDDFTVKRVKDNVTIEYRYVVQLEYPGKTYDWVFEGKIDRPVFVY